MAALHRLNTEEMTQVREGLRNFVALHAQASEDEPLPVPVLFGTEDTISKRKARRILQLLEDYQLRVHRRNTLFRMCAKGHEVGRREEAELKVADRGCSVCLSPFREGEQVLTLRCGHTFHDSEIMKWLETSRECPLCRQPAQFPLVQWLEMAAHAALALPTALQILKVIRPDSGLSGGILRFI